MNSSICGLALATGTRCHDLQRAPKEFCPTHEAKSSCVGCGRRADHECQYWVGHQSQTLCSQMLCAECEHRELGGHGPIVSPTEVVRQGLISVVEGTLRDAAERGLLTFKEEGLGAVSGRVVDDLGTHMVLTVMSGLATGR